MIETAIIVKKHEEKFYIPDHRSEEYLQEKQKQYPNGGSVDYRWLKTLLRCWGLPTQIASCLDENL